MLEAKKEKKTKRHIVKMKENLYVIVIICDICDNKISLHFTFILFFYFCCAFFSLTTPKDFDYL